MALFCFVNFSRWKSDWPMPYRCVCEQGSSKINNLAASLSSWGTLSGWPLQVPQYRSCSQLRLDQDSSPSVGSRVVGKHHPWMGRWNKERGREQIYMLLPEAHLIGAYLKEMFKGQRQQISRRHLRVLSLTLRNGIVIYWGVFNPQRVQFQEDN